MELQILTENEDVKKMYQMVLTEKSSKTYSFNLYFIKDEIIQPRTNLEIDLGIQCNLKKFSNAIKLKTNQLYTYQPFWLIPNKYITKTPLISQNSPILSEPNSSEPNSSDFNLIVCLFNNSDNPYKITTGMSLFKIVSCNDIINKINLN